MAKRDSLEMLALAAKPADADARRDDRELLPTLWRPLVVLFVVAVVAIAPLVI
jgi:hypothetical protein